MLTYCRPKLLTPCDKIFFQAKEQRKQLQFLIGLKLCINYIQIFHIFHLLSKLYYLLAIVISHAHLKDSLSPQLFQPFVHIFAHSVKVLICLVTQTKNLKIKKRKVYKLMLI